MGQGDHKNYGSVITLSSIKIEDAVALVSCHYFIIVADVIILRLEALFLMFFPVPLKGIELFM